MAKVLQVSVEKIFEPELIKMDDINHGLSQSDMLNYFVPFLVWDNQRKYVQKLEKEIQELEKLLISPSFKYRTNWDDGLITFDDKGNVTLPVSLWKSQQEYIAKLEKEIAELKKKNQTS